MHRRVEIINTHLGKLAVKQGIRLVCIVLRTLENERADHHERKQ